MVPLSAVISTTNIVGPYSLTRFNMYPAITINGNPASGVSSGDAMKAMTRISDEILPKDMDFAWSGTSLQEQQSSGQIGPILALALTFVYLFLVALYESWMLPAAVLMISPVALLGAIFFQYVSGLSLDIYAQVGLVMLIGLSTKQAILIVEFAKDAMEGVNGQPGLNYIDAAMQAAKLRFRAVMMTNIAFILGLLPLVFAHGAGAGSRHSIGVSVFGGMLAVAFLGSILVPAFFVMTNVVKEKLQNLSIIEGKINEKLRLFIIFIIFLMMSLISSQAAFWHKDNDLGNDIQRKSIPTAEMSNLKKKVMILWLFMVVSRILLILVLKNV